MNRSTHGRKILANILLAALLLAAYYFHVFSYAEYKAEDALYQKPGLLNPDITIFGIDEWALEQFGPFQQWDRSIMAEAIERLNSGDSKPKVIGIDILYVGEGANTSGDQALVAAAEAGGNVVLASRLILGDIWDSNENSDQLVGAHLGLELPFDALNAATKTGLVNGIFDSDGVIRSSYLVRDYDGVTLPSFSYQIYQQYTGKHLTEYAEKHQDIFIAYSGFPGDYSAGLSFADIFDENFDPNMFNEDSIVLIGPYASGMEDAYFTPLSADTQMNGVEIHANALQTLLSGNLKHFASPTAAMAVLLAVVLLALVISEKPDIRVVLAAFLALGAAYAAIAMFLFNSGYILPIFYPLMAIAVIYLYQLIYRFVVETFEKQRIKSIFGKYTDPKLVDQLIETGAANSDEVGVMKDIAVLFVDIRGFTPMTEALKDQPELVVSILNEYLELTSLSVFNHGGSVDKFIGDATMALFNGFVPLDDYVYKAVLAAWDIVRGAAKVNASIKEKYGVDIGFGVGVACGEAIVGNLGPSFRKDYTAIGDTVNTAARLESNAKRSQVLISAQVYALVEDRIEAESIGNIPLKGKSIPLEVFSVTGIKGEA